MVLCNTRLKIKFGFLIILLCIPGLTFSQTQKGRVLSSETKAGIGFVNVGIIGKNIGTVTDVNGDFSLTIDNNYNNDSIRFSMIGYESKSFLVSNFKENPITTIYLNSRSYALQEVKVIYHKPKEIRLGYPVTSDELRSGFAFNDLGSELGVKIHLKGLVKLTDINLNVAICTYDSVTYRLNIYQVVNKTEYKNILTKPIYISFTKDEINNALTFNLSKYSIIIEGDVLVTLELYKNLGEGRLLFRTEFFTGTTYHKKTSEGNWTMSPGEIGMCLHGLLIR
jgi:CarboxypepD_reg-like domain